MISTKNIFLTVLCYIIFSNTFAQTSTPKKSFDKLKILYIKEYNEVTATIDSTTSILYNCPFDKIKTKPENFTLEDFECELRSVIIANVLWDKQTNKRAILMFGACPEMEFYLYDIDTKNKIAAFSATNIIVPGNGSIYTSGHFDAFNVRRKFTYTGSVFKEDIQPFYYVGLKSKTLKEVKLYSDKEFKNILAVLPTGYEIEVLLCEHVSLSSIYLVRTSFGLTGWAKLQALQYQAVDVEGLFVNDD